jgi:hypothetical protein
MQCAKEREVKESVGIELVEGATSSAIHSNESDLARSGFITTFSVYFSDDYDFISDNWNLVNVNLCKTF